MYLLVGINLYLLWLRISVNNATVYFWCKKWFVGNTGAQKRLSIAVVEKEKIFVLFCFQLSFVWSQTWDERFEYSICQKKGAFRRSLQPRAKLLKKSTISLNADTTTNWISCIFHSCQHWLQQQFVCLSYWVKVSQNISVPASTCHHHLRSNLHSLWAVYIYEVGKVLGSTPRFATKTPKISHHT